MVFVAKVCQLWEKSIDKQEQIRGDLPVGMSS